MVDDINVEYTTVGLNDVASKNVSVFPNPASNRLTIQSPSMSQKQVEIVDAFGKIALATSTNANNITLDTSALSNGVYTLRMRHEYSTSTQLVVIQH